MFGELEATELGISAWKDSARDRYDIPIVLKDFNPSMSDPFILPPITIDDLTYTVELTSVEEGNVRLRGYVDIDTVGRCEVKGDFKIWKEGSEKPYIPSRSSGCSTGASGVAFLLFALCAVIKSRHVKL